LKRGKRASSQKLQEDATLTEKAGEQTEGNKTNNCEDQINVTMSELNNEGPAATNTANGNIGESLARDEGARVVTTESKRLDMTEESKTVLEEPSHDNGTRGDASVRNNAPIDGEGGADDLPEENVRRVMFETDNWEDCVMEAVWFGQKIPQRRRQVGRQSSTYKDPVKEFFEDTVTLHACKERLLDIASTYMKASHEHDREWEEEKVRESWAQSVRSAGSITALMPLIVQLDDGMSLPTSLCTRQGANGEPGKIQRLKLQLFKFWPSQDLKTAWKSFLEQEGSLKDGNVFALFIVLKILETACEQFSVR